MSIDHAHVAHEGRDCDGVTHHEYVILRDDDQTAEEFKIQTIHSRFYSMPVAAVLDIASDGFRMDEETEEGYRRTAVRWCDRKSCPDLAATR